MTCRVPAHPDDACSLRDLRQLKQSKGDYQKAEQCYLEAHKLQGKALGLTHPDLAYTFHDLAGLYCQQARYRQAEPLFERALAIRQETLGPDHPHPADTLAA